MQTTSIVRSPSVQLFIDKWDKKHCSNPSDSTEGWHSHSHTHIHILLTIYFTRCTVFGAKKHKKQKQGSAGWRRGEAEVSHLSPWKRGRRGSVQKRALHGSIRELVSVTAGKEIKSLWSFIKNHRIKKTVQKKDYTDKSNKQVSGQTLSGESWDEYRTFLTKTDALLSSNLPLCTLLEN